MIAEEALGLGGLPPASSTPRRGLGYFLNGYWQMLVWELKSLRNFLPVLTAVLILQGAGFVLGIGLFFRHIPETAALYVVTGVPALNLLTIGLIFEPQVVSAQRAAGTYEFIRALPVPRSMMTLAWYTVSLAPPLPAVVLALIVGVARYHFSVAISPAIVPAVLMTSLTGTLVGYAIAHGVSSAPAVQLLSSSLVFIVFGFSPIVFPAAQLPGWLAAINTYLPFGSMATVVRAALVPGFGSDVGRAYVVLAVWAAAAIGVTAMALGRRH